MDWINYSSFIRIALVAIVAGFIPISAISFFSIMMPQKEKDFKKSISEMGISTSRKVRDSYSPGKYILPVGFTFLIFLVAISVFIFGVEGDISGNFFLVGAFLGDENSVAIANQSLSVVSYAILGSFLYISKNIIRRLIANDLPPSVYYSAGIRTILASAVALVLSFLLGSETSSVDVLSLKGSLPAIGLLAGIFPQRILNYIIRRYQEFVSSDSVTDKYLSLYNIEGISIDHKERLEEIGIDNAQNLATASLTQLIAETPFDARQLLDWIGQAKLVSYAKEDITRLRAVGIRSVVDLMKGNKSREALRELADATGLNTPILEVIHGQIMDDSGIQALFNFQEKKDSPERDYIATMELNKEDERITVGG